MAKLYDFLVVGAGPFGATFAYEAHQRGKKVLVIDKRDHIAGNLYTKRMENIDVHYYGAHIFHTANKQVWDYVHQFATFNHYVNAPVANYKGEIYNLPFNMNTFNKLWGVITPQEAKAKIAEQQTTSTKAPTNLEEAAIGMVGKDIYFKLIKGYTEKQWGRSATELPPFIIKRLPVRFTYDNNYFNDPYQGIPKGGYTQIVEKMLTGIDVQLNTDFFQKRAYFESIAEKILYTGAIDEFYQYQFGVLEYRSLRFEHEVHQTDNYQGNAVVNYTDSETPYTRIIEHKHFDFGTQPTTVISKEYSVAWKKGDERYYPINDEKNNAMFAQYKTLANQEKQYVFGGRLADYKYYDTHHVIANALTLVDTLFKKQ